MYNCKHALPWCATTAVMMIPERQLITLTFVTKLVFTEKSRVECMSRNESRCIIGEKKRNWVTKIKHALVENNEV